MMIAFATSLASLACQGCVSGDAMYAAQYEPASEPSLGMTLAVPGLMGNGALNAPSAEASASLAATAGAGAQSVTQLTSPASA